MAKITGIRCIRTRANGTWLFVKVLTDQPGLYGIGSASDHYLRRTVATAIEQSIAPRLIGRDASRIEDIWQSTFTSGTGGTARSSIPPSGRDRHRVVGYQGQRSWVCRFISCLAALSRSSALLRPCRRRNSVGA